MPHTLTYPAVPLQQLLTDTAARYPRSIAVQIEFRSDLPKSTVGKILRRQLADEERVGRLERVAA